MRHHFLLVVSLACAGWSSAQEMIPRSTASIASGGLRSVTLSPCDVADSNVATDDAPDAHLLSAAAYCTVPFCLSELSERSLRLSCRQLPVALRAELAQCGNANSCFTSVRAGAARSFRLGLSSRLLLGWDYRFLFHRLALAERANTSFCTAAASLAMLSPALTLSFVCQNPERRSLSQISRHVPVPTVYWLSARWQGAGLLSCAAELEKALHQDPLWRMAIGIHANSRLSFQSGFCSQGYTISVGSQYAWHRVAVAVAISHNAQVGVTSSGSLNFFM